MCVYWIVLYWIVLYCIVVCMLCVNSLLDVRESLAEVDVVGCYVFAAIGESDNALWHCKPAWLKC